MKRVKFKTIDEYLSTLPPKSRKLMKEMRKTIKLAAPGAEELISYNMPAFRQEGMLVYYAAHTGHIGFYPVSSAIKTFNKELSGFEVSKGTIRFPLEQPIPLSLVAKIVKFRVKENMMKAMLKKRK